MTVLSVILLLVCLVLSAFFAGMETGVIAINRLRLRHLVRWNARGAAATQYFISKTDRLLGTTLVGTNLCHVVASILTAALAARALGARWAWVGSVLLTLIVLVGCEYLPKAWFQSHPAQRVLPFAGLLKVFARIFAPVGRTLTGLVTLVVRPARDRAAMPRPMVSREELLHLAGEGARSGVLTPHEHRMIHGVFELNVKRVAHIMIPRDHMVCVPASMSADAFLDLARDKVFNRYPVYEDEPKRFVGVVHIFDVLADPENARKTVEDFMRPPQFVNGYTSVDHLLPRMRVTKQPMVLVTNERFDVVGLVTLEDVIEEIVGPL